MYFILNILVALLFVCILLSDYFWKALSYHNQMKTTIFAMMILLLFFGMQIIRRRCFQNIIHLTYMDVFCVIFSLFYIAIIPDGHKNMMYEVITLLLWYYFVRTISHKHVYLYYLIFPLSAFMQIIIGSFALSEPWQGLSYINGVFTNSSVFGGYVAITAVLLVNVLCVKKNAPMFKFRRVIWKFLLWGILLMLLFQLIISGSRAGWVSYMIPVFLLILYRYKKMYLCSLKIKLILTMMCIILGLVLAPYLYLSKKDSADGRILIWKVATTMITNKPVLGYGLNGIKENYMNFQSEYLKRHPESKYVMLAGETSHVFNEYISWIIRIGVFSIIPMMVLLYLVFFYPKKKSCFYRYNVEQQIIKNTLLAFGIFSLFSYPCYFVQFNIFLVFLFARLAAGHKIIYSINLKKKIEKGQIKLSNSFIKVVTLAYFIFFVYWGYSAICYWSALYIWQNNMSNRLNSNSMKLEVLSNLYEVLKFDALFLYQYGLELAKNQCYPQAIFYLCQSSSLHARYSTSIVLGDIYKANNAILKADEYWNQARYMIPSRFLPLYNLMKLYEDIDITKSKYYAYKILVKDEKISSPRSLLMRIEAEDLILSK